VDGPRLRRWVGAAAATRCLPPLGRVAAVGSGGIWEIWEGSGACVLGRNRGSNGIGESSEGKSRKGVGLVDVKLLGKRISIFT
jgi:hypothetical protein